MIVLAAAMVLFAPSGLFDPAQTLEEFDAQMESKYAAIRAEPLSTDADIYIDPSITGAERSLLQREMLGLPVSTIQDFVWVDDNGVSHANRPELLPNGVIDPLVGPNLYQDSTGEYYSGPSGGANQFGIAVAEPPPAFHGPSAVEALLYPPDERYGEGTGPFRRVYERARTGGLTWCRTSGQLPPATDLSPKAVAPNDSAYVYVTPWYELPQPNPCFDFGLKYSHDRRSWDFLIPPSNWAARIWNGSYVNLYLQATGTGRIWVAADVQNGTAYWYYHNYKSVNTHVYPRSPYLAFGRCCSIGQSPNEGMHGSYFLHFRYGGSSTDGGGFGSDTTIHPSHVVVPTWPRIPVVTVATPEVVSIDTR